MLRQDDEDRPDGVNEKDGLGGPPPGDFNVLGDGTERSKTELEQPLPVHEYIALVNLSEFAHSVEVLREATSTLASLAQRCGNEAIKASALMAVLFVCFVLHLKFAPV